jgi:hypothetical protein
MNIYWYYIMEDIKIWDICCIVWIKYNKHMEYNKHQFFENGLHVTL